MKIAIIGYGLEGQAALEYWQSPDNQITVCDQKSKLTLPAGVQLQTGNDYLANLDRFDLIVRSPGIRPELISLANPNVNLAAKITSVTNEFYKVSPTNNIIGVTGTKGKGTTSTLIYQILKAAGKTVYLGGNIGLPALSLLQEQITSKDWVVLEQSSFQLCDQAYSPHIAVCLIVVPEHLNWHANMDDYRAAKARLFSHQKANDIAIFNRLNKNSQTIAAHTKAKTVISYEVPAAGEQPSARTGVYVADGSIFANQQYVCSVQDVALIGYHNLQNVCAAIAATWDVIDQQAEVITTVVRSFKGLPHRLEFVAEHNKVRYYDDSFGTTPETAMVAIQTFAEPKVVILGGADKKVDFTELAKTVVTSNVRAVVLIGETGPAIGRALAEVGYTKIFNGGQKMPEIVNVAHHHAQPGDVVLLSTGCASFGLFNDYKDRGNQFKQAVTALP